MGKTDKTESGRRIRQMREAHQLTQAALAKLCYVTQPAVAQWEAGKTTPQLMARVMLAEKLRTTQDYLFPRLPDDHVCCGECGR